MKTVRIAVATCGFIMLCYCQSFAGTWHIESVDTNGVYTSIALDSSENPHISCSHGGAGLNYAHWNGTAWEIQTVGIHALSNVQYTSLALDSSGNPHISYMYDDGVNYDIGYAYCIDSTWQLQTIETAYSLWNGTSIALDSSDNPHISYYGYGFLKYAHWDGTTWWIQVVDAPVGYVEDRYTSIALDSSDNPHISYIGSDGLRYAYWTGSNWEKQTVDSNYNAPPWNSLALDSSGNPHFSYSAYYPYSVFLKYARWNGSAWEIQTVDESGGWYTSIAVDSYGYPHISYMGDGTLKYARWNGSTWEIQTVDASGGWWTSIALDSSDNPHISYYDYDTQCLKYAWYEPTSGIDLLSFSAQAQSEHSIALSWQVQATEGEQIAGFNLHRREINNDYDIVAESYSFPLQKNNGDWKQINSSLITGENPYEYTDGDVHGGLTYEYQLEAVLADESAQTLGTAQTTAEQPTTFAITRLYPNPASDILTCLLSVLDAGLVNLELYDLSGRLVACQKLEATGATDIEAVMDVSSLTSGVYTLKATCNGAEANARCVVAK